MRSMMELSILVVDGGRRGEERRGKGWSRRGWMRDDWWTTSRWIAIKENVNEYDGHRSKNRW